MVVAARYEPAGHRVRVPFRGGRALFPFLQPAPAAAPHFVRRRQAMWLVPRDERCARRARKRARAAARPRLPGSAVLASSSPSPVRGLPARRRGVF